LTDEGPETDELCEPGWGWGFRGKPSGSRLIKHQKIGIEQGEMMKKGGVNHKTGDVGHIIVELSRKDWDFIQKPIDLNHRNRACSTFLVQREVLCLPFHWGSI